MDSFSTDSKKNLLPFLFGKNLLARALAFFLFVQFFIVCDRSQNQEQKEILLNLIGNFQVDLQKNLQTAIQKQGVLGALEVCRTISPQKEKDLREEFPAMRIRRVSEKPRNPDHKPEEWEARIFNEWAEASKTGMAPYTVILNESNQVRILKPIVLENPTCLKCHGGPKDISPAVAKRIAELYPNDHATGYKLGDLRGAFSATW
ncbi:DUF3365 domain-containing protein [Leptospira sp. 201903070]|uniref:DUF3365 domain-containing protein n=1 Tax=Leptospira ainlahdjerensis TaxID=2810033 RepID=A0ABS2UAT7_9LEPT|nr:DUF3365 domain-containing protein [Leptospira ainlahdjerensis]MBM9576347.1 DUF3365 domain-containing protein [Leptospira ainlahdjerensis]